jgi:hypothetical protein
MVDQPDNREESAMTTGLGTYVLRLDDGSRMSWEVHVRFYEGPKVKLLRPTHPYARSEASGVIYTVPSIGWDGQSTQIQRQA